MSNWNAAHYLKFGDERTRAAADLVARIQLNAPATIADLGCGPGNSTRLLRERWPNADIVGVDSSDDMLGTARDRYPDQKWITTDIARWQPADRLDLVYSNAALQWVPNHHSLVRRLLDLVAPNGALAFQIPSSTFATIRTLIYDISRQAPWNDRMAAAREMLTMQCPTFYYDALANDASRLDIWETEYIHIMDSPNAIVQWISSTGLRPFLSTLNNENERDRFISQLNEAARDAYPLQRDGKVLFPFRRTFVIAYR